MLRLGLLASLLSLCCGEKQTEVAILTDNHADFTYTDLSSGIGLHVVSTSDSLFVATLDGQSLVEAEEATNSMRLIGVGLAQFIQVKTGAGLSRDFAVPDAFRGVLTNQDQGVLRDLVMILNSSGSYDDQELQLWEAVTYIMTFQEVSLLQELVYTFGGSGATGRAYPSLLPFYMAASRIHQLLEKTQSNLTFASAAQPRFGDDCLSECPPCPYQECLGLCGYGCNCWKFVCGDCCCHLGCYEHDICCREKFVRTACLFPFGFKCESGYNCD